MNEELQSELVRDFDGAIGTMIVDENADIDQVGQFPYRRFQRLLRVVSGEHDGNAFAVDHAVFSLYFVDDCWNHNRKRRLLLESEQLSIRECSIKKPGGKASQAHAVGKLLNRTLPHRARQ